MINLDKTNFNEKLNEGYVCVQFGGQNCIPCHELKPKLESIENKYPNVNFYYIDSTNNKQIAMKYKVMGLPVVLVIDNGKEVKRFIKQMCEIKDIEKVLSKF